MNNETSENDFPAQTKEKGKQTGLLVVLLLLLGVFGYLYFFTGLIRPQEAPPAPQPPPQVVKQPLPARDAAPADAIKPADAKQNVAVPVTPSAVPGNTATTASAQKTGDVKPVTPAAKTEVKKTPIPPAKPSNKPDTTKAAVAPAVKKVETAKPATPPKPDLKKAASDKVDAKKDAASQEAQSRKAKPVHKKAAVLKPGGPWTVVAGLYVIEETLASDLVKVKKAGLTPIMTIGPKRPVSMHRLFYQEFNTKADAQQAVEMLRRTAGSGFYVQHGDKYEVFVGSYVVLSGAQAEQQRLAATGIKVSIRKSQVPIASRKLTVGTFTDRKMAENAMKKLKAAGISSPVLE